MPRVLLLLPTTTYRTKAFVEAALKMDVDVVAASEQPSTLADKNPEGLLTLDFDEPGRAARQVEEFATGLGALLYSSNHGIKAITRKKLERADKAFLVKELLPRGRVLLH